LGVHNYNQTAPAERIVFWVFAKSEDLRPILPLVKDVVVTNLRDGIVRINPFESVLNMRADDHTNILAGAICQALGLLEASKSEIVERKNTLDKKYAAVGEIPSLHDFYDEFEKHLRHPMSQLGKYEQTVLNRLKSLVKSSLSGLFDCSKGHMNQLISTNCIFELEHLTNEQQTFLVNYLLTHLFAHKSINESNVRHWVVVDDANLIFQRHLEMRPEAGLPLIHYYMTEVRKSKIKVIACSQTPSQLGSSIHSNSFAKIMFALPNGEDVLSMTRSMGITDEEQFPACYELNMDDRNVIIKFAGRWSKPFLARIPEVPI